MLRPEKVTLETKEVITNPEDKENFEGEKILVVCGPDAHGISMGVTSAEYLKERGARPIIYAGSPVIRKGEGATHPGAFYSKTLPKLDVGEYDRIVIADIPLDFRNLKLSKQELIRLSERIDQGRKKRGLPKQKTNIFFIDHHGTTIFEEVWEGQKEEAPPPSKNIENYGVTIKLVETAEACRLGSKESKIARIGAIADRDPKTLPVTDEEMLLARGLDAAVRPDPDDPKPEIPPKEVREEKRKFYEKSLKEWENRVQARLKLAIKKLQEGDWNYFKKEAEKVGKIEIPLATGFGQVAIVDTETLSPKWGVLKTMELAIENQGIEKTPYAIAVLRQLKDVKMGREEADVISIIRHWTREDLPTVEEVLKKHFGEKFIHEHKIYGAKNAKTMRLSPNNIETAKMAAKLIEVFGGKELPDFSGVKSVIMCGDPNSGKSVFSTIFREALKNLGVKVSHLDLDKAAPTPSWYLDAEIAYKKAQQEFDQGKITEEKLENTRKLLKEAVAKRKAMKRPWSIDLAEEAKKELLDEKKKKEVEFVIGDIGGGKIKKDEKGNIVKITRLTAENAKILEGTDAVIIVSNNPEGAKEWQKLIENREDPETGVKIQREKPIKIIGIYQSVLEGNIQRIPGARDEAGVITNLDRSKAEKKYNPSIFTTAVFISKAIRKAKE